MAAVEVAFAGNRPICGGEIAVVTEAVFLPFGQTFAVLIGLAQTALY
jgi:hypothetical protein